MSGFTLLELLVGIALFALLSLLVLGGIRMGMRSWDAVAARSADSEQMRVVHALLRRQLSGSLAVAASSAGRWHLQFDGDSRSLRFVSEFPTYVANGGVHQVSLEALKTDGRNRLMLKWWPLHADTADVPQDDAVLLDDLSSFEIRYFGALSNNALPQWRDRWSAVRQMPQLVKIDITTKDGVPWPPLIVPLRVDAIRFYRSASGSPGEDEDTGRTPQAPAS